MDAHDKEVYLYQMKLVNFLYERNGQKILDDVSDFEMAKMERIWNKIGEEKGRQLDRLIESLWIGMKDEMKFEIIEIGKDEKEIRCVFCPFAELSMSNGLGKVGFHKFCMSDYGIVRGFNEKIEFTRTKTLMEGHDCCNHHYKAPTASGWGSRIPGPEYGR
jgi:predicted ArsR family transcriptional regulator